MPIVVSHGEGKVQYHRKEDRIVLERNEQFGMQYIDSRSKPTQRYPLNPNGSENGLTGFTTRDGRATIMMPHPERVFRMAQLSWHPKSNDKYSPWMQMFINAYKFTQDV